MQNSRVIRRANAGLGRCFSHHRRLCRQIHELDQLLIHDEFLRDPRALWLLQNGQKETLNVDLASSESELEFKCSESSADSEDCHQGNRMSSTYPTRQQSPAMRGRCSRENRGFRRY
ncbi:hypothetical protein KR054_006651 [Drosophila jambulina]|nr:hypothetical protein KR054_006651 [Drosophila jambulina]